MDKYSHIKKRWRDNNLERAREVARNWARKKLEENPEEYREKARKVALKSYYKHHSMSKERQNTSRKLKRENPIFKETYNAKQREYRKSNPEKFKAYYMKNRTKNIEHAKNNNLKRYGLTQESLSRLKTLQEGKCAICKFQFEKTPSVDHDHESGKVRGLLCSDCNILLGYLEKGLRKNKDIIKESTEYLKTRKGEALRD